MAQITIAFFSAKRALSVILDRMDIEKNTGSSKNIRIKERILTRYNFESHYIIVEISGSNDYYFWAAKV